MGIHDFKIEMLFLSNDRRGNGIDKKLANYIDINEQNT